MGTVEDAAAVLGLSVETICLIEKTHYYWAMIDPDMKAIIERRLGPFPIYEEIEVPETRYGATTEFLDDIEKDIEDFNSKKETRESGDDTSE